MGSFFGFLVLLKLDITLNLCCKNNYEHFGAKALHILKMLLILMTSGNKRKIKTTKTKIKKNLNKRLNHYDKTYCS